MVPPAAFLARIGPLFSAKNASNYWPITAPKTPVKVKNACVCVDVFGNIEVYWTRK